MLELNQSSREREMVGRLITSGLQPKRYLSKTRHFTRGELSLPGQSGNTRYFKRRTVVELVSVREVLFDLQN